MLHKSINHSYFYQLYVYLYVLYNAIEYNYINRHFIKLASFSFKVSAFGCNARLKIGRKDSSASQRATVAGANEF